MSEQFDDVVVPESGSGAAVSREFLAERDFRMFRMRQSGVSHGEIGRRFGVSVGVVSSGVSRVLGRLARDASLVYPEVLRLELERLDSLQAALWPLTQFRREVVDGLEVVSEPDSRAVGQVLGVMDRRAKLLGMDVSRVEVAGVGGEVRSSLGGGGGGGVVSVDMRGESLRLLELLGEVGVLDEGVVEGILADVGDDDVVDGEVVE